MRVCVYVCVYVYIYIYYVVIQQAGGQLQTAQVQRDSYDKWSQEQSQENI